jgi:L-ribulose-5-phosphate 4-epimerase
MKYADLRQTVFDINKRLVESGLVILTFGNASAADRDGGLFAIKPSGVAYDRMEAENMVVVSIETGEVVSGSFNPSSDTPTHLELYRAFPEVGGIVHTHSTYATAWAQAVREIPCYGTTHADHFYGAVPVTRQLTADEIEEAYEVNSGRVIVEHFKRRGIDPLHMPAVLLPHHGPFTWGKDGEKALINAVALEAVAHTAALTEGICPGAVPAPVPQIDKHFLRKHGPDAYYGQGSN